MKQSINIVFLILLGAAFASCKKFLDVTPNGVVIPEEVSQYEQILNSPSITESFPQQIIYMNDNASAPFTKVEDAPDANAYFWKSQLNSEVESNPAIWGPLYRSIYNTNIIIDGVMNAKGGSAQEKQEILGEALVMRAAFYFDLATVYAKAYDKATAAANPGIPLVTGIDVTEKTPARASVAATFDTIVSNLKTASGYLSGIAQGRARINKYVAYGLLSRVYLYMHDYENAVLYADKALEAPHKLLDYNTFGIGYDFPFSEDNPEVLWHRLPNDVAAIYYVNYSPNLVEQYEWNDLRFTHFAMDFYGTGEYIWGGPDFGTYGITFPEIYLTKAEGLARSNKVPEAMDIVNKVLKNRIMDGFFKPVTAANGIEALQIVLNERRKELAFNGQRWADMKRLNAEGKMEAVERIDLGTGEAIETLKPGSPRYTFEIPLRVLRFNPNMEKNFK